MDKEAGDTEFTVDVVIPTGAIGNIAGAYMAKKMGVPLGYLCAGVNINDITNTVFQTGEIKKSTEPMHQTLSEAINIQLPYNLERLLFYLTDGNHAQVREWYSSLEKSPTSHTDLKMNWLSKLQTQFKSSRITDEELCTAMQESLQRFDYLPDPHTGVAFATAKKLGYLEETSASLAKNPVVLMATASPCKFQAAMTTALGEDQWKQYQLNSFPERAKDVMQREETPLVYFRAKQGMTLEENQIEWETKARQHITKF